VNVPTSTVAQTFPSTNTTQLATIGYVNQLATPTVSSTLTGNNATIYGSASLQYSQTSFTTYSGYVNQVFLDSTSFSFTINSPIPGTSFDVPITSITMYNINTGAYWGVSTSISNNTIFISTTGSLDLPYTFNLAFSGNTIN
jgi:hypothetical protein